MEKKDTYWKEASSVFREWKSGKVSLVDLTDGRLQMLDDYLTLFVSVRYAPQTDQLHFRCSKPKYFSVFKLLALMPAAVILFCLVWQFLRH